MKQLYFIDYENARWCGGQLNVLVWAELEDEALYIAEDHMEECQRELFSDEFGESVSEDEEFADESAVSVNSVELFDESHDSWKYYKMPGQEQFWPVIGTP